MINPVGERSTQESDDQFAAINYEELAQRDDVWIRTSQPDFYGGLEVQEVMEAAYLSAEEGRWVKLPISPE